jgi:hypothetical protein
MTLRAKLIGYLPFVLWMIWPMIPVVIAGVIASWCGCQLNEGGIHPCVVFGKDIGGTLYKMEMMGWLSLLTFPSGLAVLVFHQRSPLDRSRVPSQDGEMPTGTEPFGKDEFRCLGCGGVIRREDKACRICGWSWK